MLMAFAFTWLIAQNEIVHIYGQIKDQSTNEKLEGSLVQVYKSGVAYTSNDEDTTGKYHFKLPLGFVYDIEFSNAEYFNKIIQVDSRNIPEDEKPGGFNINVDIALLPYSPYFNEEVLAEPMVKFGYDTAGDGMSVDFKYSTQRQREFDLELARAKKKNGSQYQQQQY